MSDRLDITVEAVRDRKSVSEGVDILNVATNSSTPVISWDEIPKNVHINSVGTLPERQEIDLDTIVNSELYVDTKEGVLSDAGDVIYAIRSGKLKESAIRGDLFELVAGTRQAKTDLSGTTLFKSVGFALQDIYACDRVFHNVSRSDNS